MHARTRLITELKEVVAPLCKREQELYNRNTVLAINISLADVQQQSPCVYPPFLGDELPHETRQYSARKLNDMCGTLRSMDSDVRGFVTWNKALDLELPGGYVKSLLYMLVVLVV